MNAKNYQFRVMEDGSVRLMARMVGLNAQALIQSDIATIAWSLWSKADESTEIDNGTLVPADTVFDSLQTESWSQDMTGYNFRWDTPATLFPQPRTYELAVKFTLGDGSVVWLRCEPDALRTQAA